MKSDTNQFIQPSPMAASPPSHIAIVSSPGVGHLTPLANFAALLVEQHGFSVTLIPFLTGHSHAEQSIIAALPMQAHVVPCQFTCTGPDVDRHVVSSVASNVSHLKTLLGSSPEGQGSRYAALVVDVFGVAAFDMAKELGIPLFLFSTTSAFAMAFGIRLTSTETDLQQPVRVPGCLPVHVSDFPGIIGNRESEAYAGFVRLMRKSMEVDGILLNSFYELEKGAISYLTGLKGGPPVYPVGPLVGSERSGSDRSHSRECLEWLDKQPENSVIYTSFGSGGTLTSEQIVELALGLESSGMRFLWVVRSPHRDPSAAYFSDTGNNAMLEYLPKGFLERTENSGLVMPSWAPQSKILGHRSVGGFLTHCGWNSVLESIVNGVPMIAWPLYAEQPFNALLVTEDLKVALRPKVSESGLVPRKEIARVIKCIMEDTAEGKEIRSRMCELRNAALCAQGENGGGFLSMSEVARKWKNLSL